MCGIAGIVGVRDGSASTDRLVAMREALQHRGPDGAGVWNDRRQRVGLSHRRLAIIDRTAAGAQPMRSDDGRVTLTYNGEIYNHVDLRRELEAKGYRFRGRSDTEVLLNGYLAWGERVLDRLSGMFAFAVWDAEREELFVARDRIGIKPLYFWNGGGEFLFASEVKGLLVDPRVPREADPVAAWHYLSFLVPPAPLTTFRSIYKLPAGHFLRVRAGQEPRLQRYWDPADRPPADVDPAIYGDEDACAAEILRRLERSIERRMMSDVPFGVFLSGGVDSSANVALMARHMSRPVETFSVGFEEHEAYNELDQARRVAELFGANHHEVRINERDMQEYLPSLIHQQDEPIADWVCVPLHYVAELARNAGVTVVQVGEGSDELFCGYDHFRDPLTRHERYRRLAGLPGPLRRGALRAARFAGSVAPSLARRAGVVERIDAGEEVFWGGAICFRGEEKRRIWNGTPEATDAFPEFVPPSYGTFDSGAVVRHLMERFRSENPRADFYQQMLFLELRQRLPELLLMRVDKITMASSIEARVPFLDHDLVEFCMDLPLDLRLRNGVGKYVLKRALRNLLPAEVIDRPKMGFAAPVKEWLNGPFGNWVRDRLLDSSSDLFDPAAVERLLDEHRDGRLNRSAHIWTLLNYAMWHDHWILGKRA